MEERYDFCAIGAGTAGFAAADAAHALGKRVVLVTDEGDLGGTCILRGCMPAKSVLSSTERLGDVRHAADVGVRSDHVRADLPAIVARKRELVEYFAGDRARELDRFPLVRGIARFASRTAIDVAGTRIEADRFVIATGSHVVVPPIEGLAACDPFTSDDALEMTSIPASLLVLGGGPVGCEFAQYFSRLGSRVTLVQSEPTLLRNEDADVGTALETFLTHDGVDVRTRTTVERVERIGEGVATSYAVTLERDGTRFERRVARVMVATNRLPKLGGLDLDAAGIRASERGIETDAFLRTSNPNVYAAGDVLGRRCLVHVAAYAGRLAALNAFSDRPARADFDRFEARAVYTQPQVAVAGLDERACRDRGLDVRVRRHPFVDVGKAVVSGEPEGFVKMIAERHDGRVLGVGIVGGEAIDLIGEAVALIDRGATLADVATMPHLHPTMGEIFGRVAEDFAEASEPLPEPAGLG